MDATAEMAGGDTVTAATDGSARCTGHSPTTICTTTRCGAMAMTTRSGVTATATFTPAYSRPTATTISPATCRNTPAATRAALSKQRLLPARRPRRPISWRKCAARTVAISLACQSISSGKPSSRPREQSAALDDLANASVKAAQDLKAACPTDIALTAPRPARSHATAHRGNDRGGADGAAAAGEILRPPERRAEGAADRTRPRTSGRARGRYLWHARPELRCRTARRDGMADRRDRPNGAPDRCATREPGRAAECHHPCGGFAQGLVSDRRSAHAAGAACGSRQTTRHHAPSRQDGEFGAQRFLWNTVRRAEGAVRSDRSAADEPGSRSLDVAPTTVRRHRRGIPSAEQIIRRLLR